jgi:hypothetical protein
MSSTRPLDSHRLETYARNAHANDATVRAYSATVRSLGRTAVLTRATDGPLMPGAPIASDLVVGVGLGVSDLSDTSNVKPGEGCVHLYTRYPASVQEVVNTLAVAYGVDAFAVNERVPVRSIYVGNVDVLQDHRTGWPQPCPCGVSVGHIHVSAGTLGAVCRGRSGDRANQTFALSNNHVLANVNLGQPGDPIVQPGSFDGGTIPLDQIGVLEDFVQIDFAQLNRVDCALALVDRLAVRAEQLYMAGAVPSFYQTGNQPMVPIVGMLVGKSGRTTGLTVGYVAAIGVAVSVNMGGGQIAQFVDQISIRDGTAPFSAGGDSGSLIWTWDELRQPVGLLFAGGGGVTFANPIQDVLNALDVDLM